MIQITNTTLPGVLLIKPDVFEDHRGQYVETYNYNLYHDKGIDVKFVQDDISVSSHNVLRGIHGDFATWKLISCLYGRIYLTVIEVIDRRYLGPYSWEAFTLSDTNRLQVLVPPKYGVGHLVLSEKAIFHYKQSEFYNPNRQFTYHWNDPKLGIKWPVKDPILSVRDGG
jgi:dTDP-4-dehydrorhamnose 3,5-epimerase